MTIREKITSLGLSPQQTIEVTLLLLEASTIGAARMAAEFAPNVNQDILAARSSIHAMQLLNHPHHLAPMPPSDASFSAVFGIDLTNEIP